MRVKRLAPPVEVEPPRSGEDAADCVACGTPDDAYIWVSERWRVRAMDRPTGLPMVLILECRSHLDLGDLPNLLAAELGVMTVRLERAIRSLDGVARVHVNRWGDGSAHLHMWFLARPYGRLQLRGTFLSLWDDILPVIPEAKWRENLALVAAWLADFGGKANAEPAHIEWESPATFTVPTTPTTDTEPDETRRPATLSDVESSPTARPPKPTEAPAAEPHNPKTPTQAPTHQPTHPATSPDAPNPQAHPVRATEAPPSTPTPGSPAASSEAAPTPEPEAQHGLQHHLNHFTDVPAPASGNPTSTPQTPTAAAPPTPR
ncbi:hypothetical protein AB0F81_31135 [Actinoplanes sp. NPDC024001]|uniref:hypothetical protein n=1 Tax=Actinoplanes sp. NPDC024001 TaxID=3154598 RepID=UPI0033CA6079